MEIHKVFVDTSAWLAIFLTDEASHEEISQLFRDLRMRGVEFFTSNDVVGETLTRIVYKNRYVQMRRFIDLIKLNVESETLVQLWVDGLIQVEAFKLVERYYEHRLSLTDSTSIILVKQFKLDAILTLDGDFRKVGMRVLPE